MTSTRPAPNWLPLGQGALACGPRPGKRSLPSLVESGCDTILTLLSEREGGQSVGDAARARGWHWVWLPFENARPPEAAHDAHYRREFEAFLSLVEQGATAYIHCSAGLHRTGMAAAAVLLLAGRTAEQTKDALRALRPATADELTEDRWSWALRVSNAGQAHS